MNVEIFSGSIKCYFWVFLGGFLAITPPNVVRFFQLLKLTYHYSKLFLLHNTKVLMMIVYQLSVYFILIISNDLSEVSINTSVTLSVAAVLELLLQTFGRIFQSRFILMLYFMSYMFSS